MEYLESLLVPEEPEEEIIEEPVEEIPEGENSENTEQINE
jgi:hypothetical protein